MVYLQPYRFFYMMPLVIPSDFFMVGAGKLNHQLAFIFLVTLVEISSDFHVCPSSSINIAILIPLLNGLYILLKCQYSSETTVEGQS